MIKAKGFAKDKTVEALREIRPMSVLELSAKIEGQLEEYHNSQQTQPFANFMIQLYVSSFLYILTLFMFE